MGGQRSFIEADNQGAVDVGGLRRGTVSVKVKKPPSVFAIALSVAGAKILQKKNGKAHREGVWPYLDPWDVVLFRTSSSVWNVLGKYRPHGELFFFLIKKDFLPLKRQCSMILLFLRRRSRHVL